MGLFKKKPDPLSDRARSLNQEIAQLEAQIKKLDSRLQKDDSQPRLRSTALPHGTTVTHQQDEAPAQSSPKSQEPIFEEIDVDRLKSRDETPEPSPEHFNDLGMRKYDLAALFRRWRNHFQGPATTNPRLVSYLAAGGIQGLRPLRYEKRVARNRFIALVIVLFLTLLGIVAVFLRSH
jgi:cell division protein FtsB